MNRLFTDVLFGVLAMILLALVILLPHINPEGTKETNDSTLPGNIMVEVFWPDDWSTDVDLWIQAPGDVPVGYSNKGGAIFNLLRDDLGKRGDATNRNYEVAYGRGIPPGRYIINLQLFRHVEAKYLVPVEVIVSVKQRHDGQPRQILATKVNLERQGQELTVFRFILDEEGNLEPGSVDNIQVKLRSQRVGG